VLPSSKGEREPQTHTGKDNVRLFLQQHPEVAKDIEGQIRAKLIPEKATMNRGEKEAVASEAVAR